MFISVKRLKGRQLYTYDVIYQYLCAVRPPGWGNVFVIAAPPSFGRVFFCHTNAQDHFQRFLRTREGGGVNWEMAKLVLLAELCSVLQLWQKGNERRERQTDNPLSGTELKWGDNLLRPAGLLSSAGKQWAWMNEWRRFLPYQHGECIAVVYGAGQDGGGVAKVSLEIAVCVAVGQQ